jgi:hypothetical protein
VAALAAERVGMTVAGGVTAMLLTALAFRRTPLPRPADPPT